MEQLPIKAMDFCVMIAAATAAIVLICLTVFVVTGLIRYLKGNSKW